MGGAIFNFSRKNRPQKHQKRAILHTSQAIGGARTPPPPLGYATGNNNNTYNNAGLSTSTTPGESRSFAQKSSYKLYISHVARGGGGV